MRTGTYRHHSSPSQFPYDNFGVVLLAVPNNDGVILIKKLIDGSVLLVIDEYDNDEKYTGIVVTVCIH